MLKYVNGKILTSAIPNETTLVIKIAMNDIENAKPLSEMFLLILKEYGRHITTVAFIGGEEEQYELVELCKQVHKAGLKTCLSTYITDKSQLNLNLLNELDYLQLSKNTYKKDYSPFGDIEDWIDV